MKKVNVDCTATHLSTNPSQVPGFNDLLVPHVPSEAFRQTKGEKIRAKREEKYEIKERGYGGGVHGQFFAGK